MTAANSTAWGLGTSVRVAGKGGVLCPSTIGGNARAKEGISNAVSLNLGRLRSQQDVRGLAIAFSVARETPSLSHLFWIRNCRKSHWTTKGHRIKKSSVGAESPRGQGRVLGGLCSQEGGESEASPASVQPALKLTSRLFWPGLPETGRVLTYLCSTNLKRAPPPAPSHTGPIPGETASKPAPSGPKRTSLVVLYRKDLYWNSHSSYFKQGPGVLQISIPEGVRTPRRSCRY